MNQARAAVPGQGPPAPARTATVPEGRAQRFLALGRALGAMAAHAAGSSLSRLAQGQAPDFSAQLLSPANAQRLAERLSQMRGAVMKVGQLLSMDGHGVLPPRFADLLAGLRNEAHRMPPTQLVEVLERAYGTRWDQRFRRFSFEPIAAASIGQVHKVQTTDGRWLALKIQYPGVRQSIASDMANLRWLFRTPGLLPAGMPAAAVTELLARVQAQLEHETDYRAEARAATAYRERLGPDPVLTVPAVVEEHCSDDILATEFVPGEPVDRLAQADVPQALRDHIATTLSRLAVHEFFRMRLVQTDPNFGNYLFDAGTGRIALVDFGATEAVTPLRVEQLRALGRALQADDVTAIAAASTAAGFTAQEDPPAQTQGVLALMRLAAEPLRSIEPYDFGRSTLLTRSFEQGRDQFFSTGYARTPPADLLFLQRKFAGTFLLCCRLRARVDLRALFAAEL